jgi:hypothetical protein
MGGAVDASSDESEIELDRFELVLLLRPDARPTVSKEESDRLQDLHVAHLASLTRAGAIRVAGPFDEQSDQTLRGLAIYQTGSLERTRHLAESDPAVVAGRLAVDVMYFYCPKGQL